MTDRSAKVRDAFAQLERVRGNLSEAEFAQLVAHMLSMVDRLEGIDAQARGRNMPRPGTLPGAEQHGFRHDRSGD